MPRTDQQVAQRFGFLEGTVRFSRCVAASMRLCSVASAWLNCRIPQGGIIETVSQKALQWRRRRLQEVAEEGRIGQGLPGEPVTCGTGVVRAGTGPTNAGGAARSGAARRAGQQRRCGELLLETRKELRLARLQSVLERPGRPLRRCRLQLPENAIRSPPGRRPGRCPAGPGARTPGRW